MSKKAKTQTELLQEIVDLLTPMNNLAIYQIGQINKQIQREADLADIRRTRTADEEMRKEALAKENK